jgi:uncharacterized protein YfkK (UPF0435 family)
VYLEYGAIFPLLAKDSEELTEIEKGVVDNFKYSSKLQNKIEDLGDIYR